MGTISHFTLVFVATSALLFFFFFLLEMALSASLLARKREEKVVCVGVVGGVSSGVPEQPRALLSASWSCCPRIW